MKFLPKITRIGNTKENFKYIYRGTKGFADIYRRIHEMDSEVGAGFLQIQKKNGTAQTENFD